MPNQTARVVPDTVLPTSTDAIAPHRVRSAYLSRRLLSIPYTEPTSSLVLKATCHGTLAELFSPAHCARGAFRRRTMAVGTEAGAVAAVPGQFMDMTPARRSFHFRNGVHPMGSKVPCLQSRNDEGR